MRKGSDTRSMSTRNKELQNDFVISSTFPGKSYRQTLLLNVLNILTGVIKVEHTVENSHAQDTHRFRSQGWPIASIHPHRILRAAISITIGPNLSRSGPDRRSRLKSDTTARSGAITANCSQGYRPTEGKNWGRSRWCTESRRCLFLFVYDVTSPRKQLLNRFRRASNAFFETRRWRTHGTNSSVATRSRKQWSGFFEHGVTSKSREFLLETRLS